MSAKATHEWKMDERCIFHVDVNSAFLSWSALKQLKEQPGSVDLRTIPSAVAGDVQTRHGVITARSIPAKKYGVQTAMPVVKAMQKCPSLVLVRSDFALYREYSKAFISILKEYTDLVEQVSIDEAYLDMTATRFSTFAKPGGGEQPSEKPGGGELSSEKPGGGERTEEWPLNMARRIQEQVKGELGFTVNIGISVNRILAKTASDFEKPDRIHTLYPEEIGEKMWPLPIRELHGCGEATSKKLITLGASTIGEAAALSLPVLQSNLGEKAGEYIWKSTHGIGSSVIHARREKAKSYSNEVTTPYDITRENYTRDGIPILERLSRKVSARMEKGGVFGQTVFINVKTNDFRRHSRQMTVTSPTRDAEKIFACAKMLMEQMLSAPDGLFAQGKGVRLIGVGCTGLSDGSYMQMDLFSWAEGAQEREKQHLKKEKLADMMDKVRSRYGEGAIRKGAGREKDIR